MKEIELINKRKPREKHFLQEDGTIIAKMYNKNIHYKKNDKYEEIDNTLIKTGNVYKNRNNDYNVYFNENGNESLIKMEKDNHYIDIKIKKSKKTKIQKKEKKSKFMEAIKHKEILEDIDVEYNILPTKVKETIILHNNKNKEIIFEVDTNLKLKKQEKKLLAMSNENIIFTIEPPYMIDSNGNMNTNVEYKLTETSQNYEIQLILDEEWLQSKKIKYPVYIDPTITNTSQEESSWDTYIYSGDTDITRYNEEVIKAGVERKNNQDIVNRALLRFELPVIGTGSEVVGAELVLTGYIQDSSSANDEEKLVSIHRITQSWKEDEANWENMNDKYDEKIESILSCLRSYSDGTTLTPVECSADITNLVKKWYRNQKNNGILLKSVKEEYTDNNYPAFFSKDNIIGGDPKPYFIVSYRNHNGLEEYLNYKHQNFTIGTTYVNTYNGNMVGIFNLGNSIDKKMPINVSLVYNTNDVILEKDCGFGNGYKLNYYQTIKMVEIDSLDYLEYMDEDGTIHYLIIDYTTNPYSYKDEDGLGLTATINESKCTLLDKDGYSKVFTKIGEIYYLSEVKDSENNVITIELDDENRIKRIIDRNNSKLNINYQTDKIDFVFEGSSTVINYLEEKKLSIATLQGITIFEHNDKNLISSITDITGIKNTYEYLSEKPYRISKVTQYGTNNELGQFFSVEYGFDSTTIIDNKGRCETLIFNEYGNLISINSLNDNEDINNAYSVVQIYGDELSDNKNKLLSKSIPIRYIKNYLKNTSFETELETFTTSDPDNMTREYSSQNVHTGNRALKVSNLTAGGSIEQDVVVPKGNYYTFSGYFQNLEPITVRLSYASEDGTVKVEEAFKSTNEYERNDITIYYAENATSDLRITISFSSVNVMYLDDVQLEKGEVANAYNIIENSDFADGLSDWEISVWGEKGEELSPTDYFEVKQFNNGEVNALNIKMNPLNTSNISRTFPIKGKKGELYTISFWYKNEGIPSCRQYAGNKVTIYFVPEDGEAEYCILSSEDFNTNENRWQFFSHRDVALEDYKEVRLIFHQDTEANNLYITNLSFYKEITFGDYSYDINGNLISIKNQSDNEKQLKYDENNQLISASSIKGNDLKLEYDANNKTKLINIMASSGIANEAKYDDKGNVILRKTTKKYVNELTDGVYKIRNKGTDKFIKAEMNYLFMEANACSNTSWKIEQHDDKYKIIYDILPNYSVAYDDNGNLNLSNNDMNNLFYIEKNENGSYCIKCEINNIIKYIKSNGTTLELIERNEQGSEYEFYIEYFDEMFIETTTTYSSDGKHITSTTDSRFNVTSYETNPVTGKILSKIEPNGNTINYGYNEKNQLVSINDGDRNILYEYNNQNLLGKIMEENRTINFSYDEFLRTKEIKIGDNITLVNKEYESNNGNLKKVTYGNAQSINYIYDEFDRIKTISRADADYNYYYDNNGNIAKIISSNQNTRYNYDVCNRLYKYKCNDFEIKYTYDLSNNVVAKQYNYDNKSHILENIINEEEFVSDIKIDNTPISYNYDSLGRINKKFINNNYQTEYTFETKGKRTSEILKSIKNGNDKYEYSYDNKNNIDKIYYNDNLTKKFNYDRYNQLVTEEDYILNQKIDYVYDMLGNILTKKIKNISSDEIIQVINYQYNESWKDQLNNYNGITIMYDEIGNPTNIGENIELSWNNGKMLSRYIDSNNNLTITYRYNEDGIRNEKIVNGNVIEYIVEDNDIIYEKRGNNIIYYLYDLTGIAGIEYNGNKYYYVKNAQNDIIGIINSNNEVVVTYEYDSWGKILGIKDNTGSQITSSDNIGIINPFRYRSYYYDEETELYYLNSRYYNPIWGRFLNADNLIGANEDINSYNLYAYASNNPITFSDTEGMFSATLTWMTVGTVIVVGLLAYAAVDATIDLCSAVGTLITEVATVPTPTPGKTTKPKKTPVKENKSQTNNNHNVYTLRDPVTNKVEYVGRTKNVSATRQRHKSTVARSHLILNVEFANVSRPIARGMEQALIMQCKTLNKDTEYPMNNQINGMSEKRVYYKEYMDAALTLLDENEVPCN